MGNKTISVDNSFLPKQALTIPGVPKRFKEAPCCCSVPLNYCHGLCAASPGSLQTTFTLAYTHTGGGLGANWTLSGALGYSLYSCQFSDLSYIGLSCGGSTATISFYYQASYTIYPPIVGICPTDPTNAYSVQIGFNNWIIIYAYIDDFTPPNTLIDQYRLQWITTVNVFNPIGTTTFCGYSDHTNWRNVNPGEITGCFSGLDICNPAVTFSDSGPANNEWGSLLGTSGIFNLDMIIT